MRMLIAMLYGLLNLVGCTDAQNRSIVVSSKENGAVTLDSLTRVEMGRAEFTCNESRSGKCYYTVFHEGAEIRRFTLVAAEHRQLDGLPAGFDQCVSTDDGRLSPSCKPVGGTPGA